MSWMLVFFEDNGDDSRPRTYSLPGRQLASYLDIDWLMREFCQGDQERAEMMLEDLSRTGARYHEFIGGTMVLVGASQ